MTETHFTEFFTRLREELDQARDSRMQFCQQTRDWVRDRADRMRNELTEFANEFRAGAAAFRASR